LPIVSAAQSNIASALAVLDFAKTCSRLRRFVSVSTAYVHPHRAGELDETLVPLPVPAKKLYEDIRSEAISETKALALLGHPNTYTLTKCLAEHLLVENRGSVPLTIVRPSIISVAETNPFPGWIDSYDALAAFVASFAAGYLRVIAGNKKTRLDVVPVDRVARIVVNQAYDPGSPRSLSSAYTASSGGTHETPIIHAVVGLENALPIGLLASESTAYFKRYPQKRAVGLKRIGPLSKVREFEHLIYHRGPLRLAKLGADMTGKKHLSRQARSLERKLDSIFKVFPYFTHHSFEFRRSIEPEYRLDPHSYIFLICEGTHKHLLRQDPHRTALAGSQVKRRDSALVWALKKPRGNETIRATGMILKKAFDRMFLEVSYDQISFERALACRSRKRPVVIVPTHRSYMDFLLCSYLFFACPDLGIDLPYIAAAQEFSKIPALGRVFRRMRAFYLKRGTGKEDPELTATIQKIVRKRRILQFFIEGQRSRTRRFLPPKRGILRCLQATGQEFDLLPVSISYDHVPEETALLNQMKGLSKEPMRLGRLLQWTHRAFTSERTLGNVHIRCGDPVRLSPDRDVREVSRELIGELQKNMPVSTYHLECFLKANPKLMLKRNGLKKKLEQKGAVIVQSHLHEAKASLLDPTLERSFRLQWLHFFIDDAVRRYPENAAIQAYAKKVCYFSPRMKKLASNETPPGTDRLVEAVFRPVCDDYLAITRAALKAFRLRSENTRQQIMEHAVYTDRPTVEVALSSLIDEKLLHVIEKPDSLALTADLGALEAFERASIWR
jgi:1-acyl-sn-glycerol-3-phosphate acyltransferase